MTSARDLILSTTEKYYFQSKLNIDNKSEEALSEFIHNPQVFVLQSFVHDANALFLVTMVQADKKKSIIFYKTSAIHLTDADAVNNINIMTLSESAAESLYQLLRQIYSPLLAKGSDLFSSKLQKNLSDLETNLRIVTHGKGDENINVILSIEDELDYWKTLSQNRVASKKEREAASTFCESFEDIYEEIKVMRSGLMSEIREAAENIGGLLDDIWRSTVVPYSKERMVHVFDVTGHTICSIIQNRLSTLDLWKVFDALKENAILTTLSESLTVMQTWTSACKSLTEIYWPNYALHTWNEKPYIPPFCLNFHNRLEEIHDIRSIYNQLNKLLTNNEKQELKTDMLFEPFGDVNIWMCNGPNQAWEAAVLRYFTSLRPAEIKIAEKLKPRLHNTSTKQMLYEFMRYKSLIERPIVKRALNNELEIFVSSLVSMVKQVQNQLETDEPDVMMHPPPEMSTVVLRVQWAKHMEARVKDIQTCAEKYLNEFEGSAELQTLTARVLKDLKAMYTQLYEEWSRDVQAQVKDGSLTLSADKPVVEFSESSRLMVVNYSPRVVRVEREARALAALGLPPLPTAVVTALDTLAAALQSARTLQQVASFHNTLGERMVPSTRPMILQPALALAALVGDHRVLHWHHTEQLDAYTNSLKELVAKLDTQNSYLTSQHLAIRNIVENLMDTDLLAKQSEWKKRVKDIRDIIEKVEANGYKNTEMWKSHWDWQLYKALECQYIRTLLSLHKHFPHVHVDLVFRGRSVRVQPPMEELRVQHYHQLRRLVSLPAHFVGVQDYIDGPSMFAAIVEKHGWLGNNAVRQLEAALSALARTCSEWSRRAALACVPDLDALCSEHLKDACDWEINFKACKAYGQAVAKMTFEDEKIEWISVGTATLRREFEAQTRNLWACLMSSLQASCRNDAGLLDAFIANATIMLENKALPKNAKELAEISAKQQALQDKMPEMEKTVEGLKRKGHMLRTWGGDLSADGSLREWHTVRDLMLSHQQMFEHQAEIVKSSLNGEWENLNSSVEAWVSRWAQTRVQFEVTHGVTYVEMAERCRSVCDANSQWDKFVVDKDELLKECEKFSMRPTLSDTWQQAETLIAEDVNLWTPFKEYNEEYESIAEQDWIVFQKKLHLLDEFVSKWASRLEPYTTITLYLQQEIDKYSDLTPLLKYLRGSDFTERHWREVFALLEMEYTKPDTLQVKNFLNIALNIKKHVKTLQKISASASSEAAIRSAINELELWFAGARLNIIYYNDKSKKPTPIVKDFKDLLSKIEEQQWVVSSVCGGEAGAGGAGGAWEARLRTARSLLRAAHHAQRRTRLSGIVDAGYPVLGYRAKRGSGVSLNKARVLCNKTLRIAYDTDFDTNYFDKEA